MSSQWQTNPAPPFQAIDEIVRLRGASEPGQILFTYLEDGEREAGSLTAGELDQRARRLAAGLQAKGWAGKTILLGYPTGLEFVIAFFGCLYANAIPVPAYPPRRNRFDPRLESLAAHAGVVAMLTTAETTREYAERTLYGSCLAGVPWLCLGDLESIPGAEWQPGVRAPGQLAYLQYSSGSTGSPHGIMVSHGNIIANSVMIQHSVPLYYHMVAATWLPNFHDMGLIDGIIAPVFNGFPCYLMAPAAFVQRPLRWLRAISKYRVVHSGGPDFGYRWCVERVTEAEARELDLSCWANAYNGAEPVRAETLRRFTDKFAPCGFQNKFFFPCYGMAETTLMVTGGPREKGYVVTTADVDALEQHRLVEVPASDPAGRALVSCGPPCIGVDLAVVNPHTLQRVPEGGVGELWVRGAHVTLGYWNDPEETAKTFNATIAGSNEGPFLRTGDLGFIKAGQIYITGRQKDLIIIRGRNHYPQDIEDTVGVAHAALRPGGGAAFSFELDGEERLAVVHEVERTALGKLDVPQVAAAVSAAVARGHELTLHTLILIKPGHLPKTSSGKVQRRGCRATWLAGELEAVAVWQRPHEPVAPPVAVVEPSAPVPVAAAEARSVGEIAAWLRRQIAARLKHDPEQLELRTPLANYGFDSLAVVDLSGQLQKWLGREVSATLFYDYPTIADIAAHLGAAVTATRAGAVASAGSDPIAVVGLACRFPGADSPAAYWDFLVSGQDAIGRFPATRENAASFDAAQWPAELDRAAWGGFLTTVSEFDAAFFGISPVEAQYLDPQQRLLLEVAWSGLEDAGAAGADLARSATGVFIGVSNGDYFRLALGQGDRPASWLGTGNAFSMVANRLSYCLDLRGPSLAVDTACSSSLVAIHQAVRSLRAGECRQALAGGVNLILSPELSLTFTVANMLAADGRCKTFDAAADGYVRGEGCGVVVLKRLADAVQDGDRIYAVVRGSAVNQDGRSNGLTAPNGPAQQAVIEAALAAAGVAPSEVGLVEAHGTGTPLGDPIEMNTLARTLSPGRAANSPCWLGSVKANIGHLESAAGVAGFIKTVLTVYHGQVPPQLHFREPNPRISLDPAQFPIARTVQPWTGGGRGRVAGVSSFGFGGTNAHIIIGEAPKPPAFTPASREVFLPLSARTEPALRELAQRWSLALAARPELPLLGAAATAGGGRAHFTQRLGLVAATRQQAADQLAEFARGGTPRGVLVNQTRLDQLPQVAFLLTGQGAQTLGMAAGLYRSFSDFRRILDEAAAVLADRLDISLLDLLWSEAPAHSGWLDQTQYAQPALYAVAYALARLWQAWGVTPRWLLGHSVGQYVAAAVAGVFGWQDGLKLMAARGRLMQSLPAGGGMLAVAGDGATVQKLIAPWADRVAVAAYNSPRNTVVSGDLAALDLIREASRNQGLAATPLPVSHAFHSPLVEPILQEFLELLRGVRLAPPAIPIICNVTGGIIGPEIATPEYWQAHLRQPVHFENGLRTLRAAGANCFIEIGPRPTLLALGQAILSEEGLRWLPSMRPGRPDETVINESVRDYYLAGGDLNWRGFFGVTVPESLPTYPFQRKKFWVTAGAPVRPARGANPLLGQRFESPVEMAIFNTQLAAVAPEYLGDHRVMAKPIVPAAAFLIMAWAAGAKELGQATLTVREASFQQPLELGADAVTVQTLLQPPAGGKGAWGWKICRPDAGAGKTWTTIASGQLELAVDVAAPPELEEIRARMLAAPAALPPLEPAAMYEACRAQGLDYGPAFQAVRQIWRGPGEALGRLELAAGETTGGYGVHPVLLDAAFQLIAATAGGTLVGGYVPVAVRRLTGLGHVGTAGWGWARLQPGGAKANTLAAEVTLYSAEGAAAVVVEGLVLQRFAAETAALGNRQSLEDSLYHLEWRARGLFRGPATPRLERVPATETVVAGARAGLATALARPEMVHYGAGLAGLEALAVDAVVQALRRLGLPLTTGQTFVEAESFGELSLAATHRRLFTRLLGMMSAAGWLVRQGPAWRVAVQPPVVDLSARRSALLAAHPEITREVELLYRCGEALAEVIPGQRDPLQILFPQGDASAVAWLYHGALGAQKLNQAVVQTVQGLLASLPPWRGVRILEIGGGTGGLTRALLPELDPARTDYLFTDVSSRFTEAARRDYAEYGFLRYRTLDIQRDPATQGFKPGEADLILAANVLHATHDLRTTMTHLRGLLAPGGAVVMLEGTRPVGFVDLIFGLTKGWWSFTDTDLRPDYPLLGVETWRRLLGQTGFAEVSVVTAPEAAGLAVGHQAVVLGRAPEALPSTTPERWVIFADEGGTGDGLARQLRSAGREVLIVRRASSPVARVDSAGWAGAPERTLAAGEAAPSRRLMAELTAQVPPVAGLVYLWGLDQPATETVPGATGTGELLPIIQAMVQAGFNPAPAFWLVTRGAREALTAAGVAQTPLRSMAQSLTLEHPEFAARQVDLDDAEPAEELAALRDELLTASAESQVALAGANRLVARLARLAGNHLSRPAGPHFRLLQDRQGSLDDLRLAAFAPVPPQAGQVTIRVAQAGLNFRDVLSALGSYPGDYELPGGECSGTVTAVGPGVTRFSLGDRVMAVAAGSFGTEVTAPADLTVRCPAGWTFEQCATLPIAGLTAWYALAKLAGLQRGQTVLIHAASGGVGQTAIQLARAAGARIFGLASRGKWAALEQAWGPLELLDSRTLDFAGQIRERTGGQGVDVVLNSLAGEAALASLRLVRPGGHFVEIGKRGALGVAEAQAINPGAHFHVLDVAERCKTDAPGVQVELAELFRRCEAGQLRPLPYRSFPLTDAVAAYRWMQQARHVGKILIAPPADLKGAGVTLAADATYLITGGLGGLGLLTAKWMAERGARQLVLVGRRAADQAVAPQLAELERLGCGVLVKAVDTADVAQVRALLEQIRQTLPPLRGVVHAAGYLDDGLLVRQTPAQFAGVLAPKSAGAWHLHTLTLGQPLDFFVLYSSAAALLGSPGQSNHMAANACLDGLARLRHQAGLPALSIAWAAWSEIGAAGHNHAAERLQARGIGAISPTQGLAFLDRIWHEPEPCPAVMPIYWPTYLKQAGSVPMLADFARQSGSSEVSLKARLAEAAPDARPAVLEAFVLQTTARVLGLEGTGDLDPHLGFFDLGLDSLTAVELRNRLQSELECVLPTTLTFDHPNVAALAKYLGREVLKWAEPAAPVVAETVADDGLDDLDEEAIAALLARKVSALAQAGPGGENL